MVLANWKSELLDRMQRDRTDWGVWKKRDFFRLVNFVVDRISVPTSRIFIGVHPDSVDTPMCWAATRDGELVFSYVRPRAAKDRELSRAMLDTFLVALPTVAVHVRDYNPFMELERYVPHADSPRTPRSPH